MGKAELALRWEVLLLGFIALNLLLGVASFLVPQARKSLFEAAAGVALGILLLVLLFSLGEWLRK